MWTLDEIFIDGVLQGRSHFGIEGFHNVFTDERCDDARQAVDHEGYVTAIERRCETVAADADIIQLHDVFEFVILVIDLGLSCSIHAKLVNDNGTLTNIGDQLWVRSNVVFKFKVETNVLDSHIHVWLLVQKLQGRAIIVDAGS